MSPPNHSVHHRTASTEAVSQHNHQNLSTQYQSHSQQQQQAYQYSRDGPANQSIYQSFMSQPASAESQYLTNSNFSPFTHTQQNGFPSHQSHQSQQVQGPASRSNQTQASRDALTVMTTSANNHANASNRDATVDRPSQSTPPANRSRDDLSNLEFAQLVQRHEELQDKYRKVKKYYFDKDAQVQQLQNLLAHQRLDSSRTSLDDNEYCSRFQRLDGAINNLAFNIRRDWAHVPPWLASQVNCDAPTAATKEMTAIGRATISQWIVEELFGTCFHPRLDVMLSMHLKRMEKDLRSSGTGSLSDEEKDLLQNKVIQWRLSTLDGLQRQLAGPEAQNNQDRLAKSLIDGLLANLSTYLVEPTPPGLEASISMIIEIAIGIAHHIPSESREVVLSYFMPGDLHNDSVMRIESGLPSQSENSDRSSTNSPTIGSTTNSNTRSHRNSFLGSLGNSFSISDDNANGKKKGMLGHLLNNSSAAMKKNSASTDSTGPAHESRTATKGSRVRLCTFMAVEIKGRSVLVKAPVYITD